MPRCPVLRRLRLLCFFAIAPTAADGGSLRWGQHTDPSSRSQISHFGAARIHTAWPRTRSKRASVGTGVWREIGARGARESCIAARRKCRHWRTAAGRSLVHDRRPYKLSLLRDAMRVEHARVRCVRYRVDPLPQRSAHQTGVTRAESNDRPTRDPDDPTRALSGRQDGDPSAHGPECPPRRPLLPHPPPPQQRHHLSAPPPAPAADASSSPSAAAAPSFSSCFSCSCALRHLRNLACTPDRSGKGAAILHSNS